MPMAESQRDNPDEGHDSTSLFGKLKSFRRTSTQTNSDSSPGPSTKTTTSERRRQQVRSAQRSHRQRKAEHDARLQAEVIALRERDATQSARIRDLKRTIRSLRAILDQAGLPYDLSLLANDQDEEPPSPMAGIAVVTEPGSHRQNVRVTLPVGPSVSQQMHPMDDAQNGIDFVLALEQPCLYHHHPGSDDPNSLSHSFMLQAPIMVRAPALQTEHSGIFGFSRQETRLPDDSQWSIPAVELERLLELGNQFDMPNEITPIRAWSQIRALTRSGKMTQAGVQGLLDELRNTVSCYGFGAVIFEPLFNELLKKYSSV